MKQEVQTMHDVLARRRAWLQGQRVLLESYNFRVQRQRMGADEGSCTNRLLAKS